MLFQISPKERAKLETLTMIKRTFVLGDEQLQLIVLEKVPDVDLNPDSPRYLGKKELTIEWHPKIKLDALVHEILNRGCNSLALPLRSHPKEDAN